MPTIFDQLRIHAACSPMKPAIMLPDRVVTYGMLLDGIGSVRAVLAGLSLDRNRPVGILIDSPTKHIVVLLALLKSGFTFVSMRPEQVELTLKCGANVILTDAKLPVLPNARVIPVQDKWFTDPPKHGVAAVEFPPDRIARILFTSGSTGHARAIGWTFRSLHNRIHQLYLSGIGSHPRFLTTFGLSNVAANYAFRVMSGGNTMVFAPFAQTLETVANFNVTEVRCSASQARALLQMQSERRQPIRIDQFSTGSGVLTVDMADAIARTFKSNVLNTYSSTEMVHIGIASGDVLELRRTRGNCFVPCSEVEIVSETGAPLPAGKEGRIRARSWAMGWPFAGNMTETEAVKGDGWFYPGDVGVVDADSLLVVTGRADEVVNDGGVKFAPEIMEAHLKRHPALGNVAVVRMQGASGQVEPWLAVAAKQPVSLEVIQTWMAHNIPGELGSVRFARVCVLDSIPMTETGKIARQQLRELLRSSQGG